MASTPGILNSSKTSQHAPEADAVTVFMPGPVRNVRHRRTAGRRRQHRARHDLLRVPFLDIDDHPHRHARAVRQLQRRAVGDRRIGDAVGRQHRPLRRPLCCRGFSRTLDHRRSMPAGRRGTKVPHARLKPPPQRGAMLHRMARYVSNAAILAGPRGHSRCLHIPSPA